MLSIPKSSLVLKTMFFFLLYSTEEPCTELIKFARASCRDDAEDGNPADPCPVLAALNKAKLKDSDSLLAN